MRRLSRVCTVCALVTCCGLFTLNRGASDGVEGVQEGCYETQERDVVEKHEGILGLSVCVCVCVYGVRCVLSGGC